MQPCYSYYFNIRHVLFHFPFSDNHSSRNLFHNLPCHRHPSPDTWYQLVAAVSPVPATDSKTDYLTTISRIANGTESCKPKYGFNCGPMGDTDIYPPGNHNMPDPRKSL